MSPCAGARGGEGLPDADTLARLVSNVTETLCGITFVPVDERTGPGPTISRRMVLLPIYGVRDISVVLSCEISGAEALTCAMRGCLRGEVTRAMTADVMGELLNMIAGQIQCELNLDQPLGLPRPTTLADLARSGGVGFEDAIVLTSTDLADLTLWVYETVQPQHGDLPKGGSGLFRSLFGNGRHVS